VKGTWKMTGPGRGTWKTTGGTSGWAAGVGRVAAAVALAYIGSAVIRAAWRTRIELAAIYAAGVVVLVLMTAAVFALYALRHRAPQTRRPELPAARPQQAELPAARAVAALPPAAPAEGLVLGGQLIRILGGYDEDTWKKMLGGPEGEDR
jgi:hypothetical protein